MPRIVAIAIMAAAIAAAGCGGEGSAAPETTEPTTTAAPDPGRDVMEAFVAAVNADDGRTAWDLLSGPTQERFGSYEAFRATSYNALRTRLRPFADGKLPIQVSERIDDRFGLVALSRGANAYATPLRREGPLWRVELPGRLRISISGPPPRSQGEFVNQIGVEVTGRAGGGTALLYLDGVTLDADVYPGPTSATVFANFASGVAPGRHTAVAFATSGDEAAATAWTFRP